MSYNSNRPKAYDVVLGGQNSTPINAAVLGGIPGVKHRLHSIVVAQRVAAVREALKYGRAGVELIFEALQDSDWQVRYAAYSLLQSTPESILKQALQEHNPYQLFQYLYKHSTGKSTAYAVAISPNGQIFASGGNDKSIKVRNLHTGRLIGTLNGHFSSIYALAISHKGQFLVSGSKDNTIKIWNLNPVLPQSKTVGEELLFTLEGHRGEVNCAAIGPNGKIIASGSEDTTIKLWNLTTGKLINTLSGHAEGVRTIAISPDGKILISGSADGSIKIWNLPAGELLQTLAAHTDGVRTIAISPDGQIFASGSQDKTIKLWQLPTGKLLRALTEHWDEVNSVAISSDGLTIASSSRDETIKLWHLATGTLLHSLEGHQGAVGAIALSPDGRNIISTSWDNTIGVWGIR